MQVSADGEGVIRIDGGIAFFDVLDDAILVDHDVGTQGPLVGVTLNVVALEDAIGREHLFVHVAEQGEFDVDLLSKGGVGRRRIHADAKNFGIGSINFPCVDSRLDRLELFGSTTCESKDIDGEKDVFLTAKITELDGFPLIAEESEIRRGVADLEGDFGDLLLIILRK